MKSRWVVIIAVVLLNSISVFGSSRKAEAETAYITIYSFAQAMADELGLTYEAGNTGAMIALQNVGIIKDGEFLKSDKNLTRGDMLVLLNRAGEYISKDTIEEWRINMVLEKRISDIKAVSASKRTDIAKGYIKGFMKGYGNGNYMTNRNLKLKNKVTKSGALSSLKLIKDKSLRAKISPDGQLIRTTNLPKNAKSYEYILASYPNKFYEKKFEFMLSDQYKAGERNPKYEIYPVDMRNSTFHVWGDSWDFSIEMNKYLYEWQKKAEIYLQTLFNVNYQTVDEKWGKKLASCLLKSNVDEEEAINSYYIKHMKENNVVIESSIIAVEPSTLYYDGDYCMRAYVKYRITAKDINVKQNRLLYAQYPQLDNLKSGEWRVGIFDIRFGTRDGYQGDGSYFAIGLLTNFVDVLLTY
jgi:hypothetical protein